MYILRLLAGKFRPTCTEFPLAAFSAKISTRLPFKFPVKNYLNIIRCKKLKIKYQFSLCFNRNKQHCSDLFCASFSQYFGLDFLARDDVFKSFKGKSTKAKCKDFYLKSFRLAIVEIELVNFVVAEFYSWQN